MDNWIRIVDKFPPRGLVLETKIDDGHGGERNVQELKLHSWGNLWWFPDDSMYVYYRPTHYRIPPPKEQ